MIKMSIPWRTIRLVAGTASVLVPTVWAAAVYFIPFSQNNTLVPVIKKELQRRDSLDRVNMIYIHSALNEISRKQDSLAACQQKQIKFMTYSHDLQSEKIGRLSRENELYFEKNERLFKDMFRDYYLLNEKKKPWSEDGFWYRTAYR